MLKEECMKNRNRLIISLFSLVLLALVGGTFAVSSDRSIIRNLFGLADYETVATEVFSSPANWQTCEEIPKTVTLKNESDAPIVARVRYSEEWVAADHTTSLDLIDSATNLRMAIVNRDNADKWVFNQDDGYYYYYRPLEPGETTLSFLKSVTLNCDANLNGSEINSCTTINGETVCTSGNNDYANATYTLRATIASIQGDAAKDEWGYEPIEIEATLLRGSYITNRIGNNTKVVRVTELPENFPAESATVRNTTIDNGGLRASTEDSDSPVYMWDKSQHESWENAVADTYEADTLYWYSEATNIYYNPNMDSFLTVQGGGLLLDSNSLSFYSSFDASRIVSLNQAFTGFTGSDFSWLSNWDVSNVESMVFGFAGTKMTDLTALSGWRLKSLQNMGGAFTANASLTSLDGAQNWFSEGSALTTATTVFQNDQALTDVSAISGWDVSNVTSFGMMFANDTALTSVSSLSTWDLSSATSIQQMFNGCLLLADANALDAWSATLSAGVDMSYAFDGAASAPSWYTP